MKKWFVLFVTLLFAIPSFAQFGGLWRQWVYFDRDTVFINGFSYPVKIKGKSPTSVIVDTLKSPTVLVNDIYENTSGNGIHIRDNLTTHANVDISQTASERLLVIAGDDTLFLDMADAEKIIQAAMGATDVFWVDSTGSIASQHNISAGGATADSSITGTGGHFTGGLKVGENILLDGNLGTAEGSYNSIIGSAFALKTGYTYCNIVGSNIANAATGNVNRNSITGDNIANAATGNVNHNSITGDHIANAATGNVYHNSITGDHIANAATGNVYRNSITGYYIANAATGNVYQNSITGYYIANAATGDVNYNSITGDNIANAATGNVNHNSIIGDNIANAATGNVYYNSITGYNIADSAAGDVTYSFSVGQYNLYNTTNTVNLSRIIALPYESLRESSASDLTDAIAIGYRAGYQNQYNSPALFGREATATANNQVVIGSSFYTGGIRLDADVTGTGDITQKVYSSNVSNPPTDAELDALFTSPATKGDGWTAYIQDSDSDNFYQIVASGSYWMIFTAAKAN